MQVHGALALAGGGGTQPLGPRPLAGAPSRWASLDQGHWLEVSALVALSGVFDLRGAVQGLVDVADEMDQEDQGQLLVPLGGLLLAQSPQGSADLLHDAGVGLPVFFAELR